MEPPAYPTASSRYRVVEFSSAGSTLRGRLYGDGSSPTPGPAVVMAHGFSATISGMVADLYAEAFAEAGLRVLLYDHHGFGTSEGTPRSQIDRWLQARGYLDAVAFCRSLEGVDDKRVAVWGDSFSAPLAMIAAAVDDGIRAVVVQVPGLGRGPVEPVSDEGAFERLRQMLLRADLADLEREVTAPMPVVSPDQSSMPSRLIPITAFRWFIEFGGRYEAGWENRVTLAEVVTSNKFDAVACAPHIAAPTLMVTADPDEMPNCDADVALQVLALIGGPTESIRVGGGHFGLLYPGTAHYERSIEGQREFLVRRLGL